jgi:hypothetical protein
MNFHLGEKVIIADPDDPRFGQIGYIIDNGVGEDGTCWVRFEKAEIKKYAEENLKKFDPN